MSQFQKTKNMTIIAVIAAMYTALTFSLSFLSFGPVQVRVAEAFTIVAVYSPVGAWAVTFSCFISNLIGYLTKANILGIVDVFLGTFATGIAAYLSYKLRNVRLRGLPLLSTLPPVILNALIIGGELTFFEAGTLARPKLFLFNILSVGLGQFISCVLLGVALYLLLERTGLDKKFLPSDPQELPHQIL